MKTKTRIWIFVIVLILTAIVAVVYVHLLDPKITHHCVDRDISVHCDEFSKYYGLPNGKCVNHRLPNFLCKSGWEEIHKFYIVKDGVLIEKWR